MRRVVSLTALALCVISTQAVAERIPFVQLVPIAVAAPDTVFSDPMGFNFVLDIQQGLAWILDETGAFVSLVALLEVDGFVNVILDGELDTRVGTNLLIGWQPTDLKADLPSTRSVFQKLADVTLKSDAGSVLQAGSHFDNYFGITSPDGQTRTWYPAKDASGIFVRDLATGETDYIDVATLAAALETKE